MVEASLKFFLQRLISQLSQEGEILSDVKDQIVFLESKLKEVISFIGDTETRPELPSWVHELRRIVHDAEDCVDKFIVQKHNLDGTDRSSSTVHFISELENIESRFKEILNRGEDSSYSLMMNYRNLPYYLKSCLMYCCIFPEGYCITKGRLIRLLVAEGLTEEREGWVMEDAAEQYIEELSSKRMLQRDGKRLKVANPYRELCFREEKFVTASVSSDIQIPSNARRISILGDARNIPTNLDELPIRSLFVVGIKSLSGDPWSRLKSVFYGVKLLRVLNLEGTKIENLPNAVGDLIHLRYLGLKKSEVNELPESLYKLQNLQTLDVRWCGRLTELPASVLKLLQLRHLEMFKNLCVGGMKVPLGIGSLTNLQTFTGLYAGGGIAKEVGGLTQLRSLGVMDVSEDHASKLYDSIANMAGLFSLSLESKHSYPERAILSVETLSPPPLLQKLRLEGRLGRTPNWLSNLTNLTNLRLGYSHLAENPTSILQQLPNLYSLSLWHAHDATQIGREFCRAGGFPKLEDLTIASYVLEEWTEIEEGAMPNLRILQLRNCLKLRMLPEGLQHLTTLQNLELMPLLDDHEQRLRPDGGEENYKIRNIRCIRFMTTSMVEAHARQSGHPAFQRSQ